MKSTPITIVLILKSFHLPEKTCSKTYEMTPKSIPSEILYVKGIMTMEIKHGIDLMWFLKSILLMSVIIITPTKKRADAVA